MPNLAPDSRRATAAPLNLAHWCVTEGVNGPGRRFTVWVQGCPRRCPGCFNPGLQEQEPRQQVSPQELAEAFAAAGPVDGVTLSGGEPFTQAAGLAAFLDALAGRTGPRPAVVAFSGYTLGELQGGEPDWQLLLGRVDLLVDGPYLAEQAAGAGPLAGSVNQRRLALSAAGEQLLARAAAGAAGEVQVQVTAAGEVVVSGFPGPGLLAALRGPG
ncbi:MAG: 4Fe-4S single cluster domain-containing protein [Deferrisomatales bacterium]|nr:4Fe-4S single cluster domain-containing protein [Deferrisomatales bacterium]